jgi:hypothetical protein
MLLPMRHVHSELPFMSIRDLFINSATSKSLLKMTVAMRSMKLLSTTLELPLVRRLIPPLSLKLKKIFLLSWRSVDTLLLNWLNGKSLPMSPKTLYRSISSSIPARKPFLGTPMSAAMKPCCRSFFAVKLLGVKERFIIRHWFSVR